MKPLFSPAGVQVLFGAGGIKEVYEDSLRAKTVDIVCLSDNYSAIIGDYFDKKFAPRLYGSSIRTREVLPDTEGNRKYAKTKDSGKNQVRFLSGKRTSESDLMLFNNRFAFVSYNREAPYAIVITDPELVKSLENQFDALWEALEF
jgi:hypothetical protein